jgi:hypothetical protein
VSFDFFFGITSEGSTVAEAQLDDEDPSDVIRQARERGVELLWLHTNADLSSFGFRRTPGYVRMRAETASAGQPLVALADADYRRTLEDAYRGLWGHKQVGADATIAANGVVLGLYEGAEAIGLCTVFPGQRLVDGPGVVEKNRDPTNYARLLLGACAVLGTGPVDLDSWGDHPDVIQAYRALGFASVEQVQGWELRLRSRAR